ncbi:DUF1573 domain-containing protein [bacterium]|nr:DUF1573 domain-containing protein [bacterium]
MSSVDRWWGGGIVLVSLLVACGRAPEPVTPPRLTVAETAYDFGQVQQGTPVEHTFDLGNGGGAPLTLIDLRTACDCTAAIDGPRDLAPGAHAAVRLRCDTSAAPGPQRRTVTVYSNDPERRALLLALTGTVALVAAADPPRVYLGPVAAGSGAVRVVALRAGNDGVRFLAVEGGGPQLRPHLENGDGGRTLVLDTAPTAPPGPFQTAVRVLTSSPARPVIEIPIAGTIDAATPTAANGAAP